MCRTFHSVTSQLRRMAKRGVACAAAVAIALSTCGQTAWAQNKDATAGEDLGLSQTALTGEANAAQSEDGTSSEAQTQIIVNRSQVVMVDCDGELYAVGATGGTVQSVLDKLDITLQDGDVCSVELDAQTYDGMCIEITRMTEQLVYTEEPLAYSTIYYEDATLAVGETKTVVAGQNGTVQKTWQVTYSSGEEASRTLVAATVLEEAVDEVVLIHTDRTIHEHDSMLASDGSDIEQATISQEAASGSASNTVTTVSGDVLTYTKVLSCTATAYTGGGITYTGTAARVGAIAVDPDVIPLGSILYIVSDDGAYVYGYCVAEDTGSAIQGSRVDLYFNTYNECITFGRRSVTVYVISTPES